MFKRMVFLFIILILSVYAAAEEIGPAQRLDSLENNIYGKTFTNGIIERLSTLEQEVFGQYYQDLIPVRLTRLESILFYTSEYGPSLTFKAAAGEWFLTKRCNQGPLLDRTAFLENILFGRNEKGPLTERIQRIISSCWPEGRLNSQKVLLPVDTLIKIKLATELHTSKNSVGDTFQYEVAENIYITDINQVLVIPAGNSGTGKIVGIIRPGKFGRDGKLELDLGNLNALDGTKVNVYVEEPAIRRNKSEKLAVGIATAGIYIAGPTGIISGLFLDGKDTVLPVGTEFYIQTKQAAQVEGLVIDIK